MPNRIKQAHSHSSEQLAIPGTEQTAAVARPDDPETSHQAAASVKNLRASHLRVLQLFRRYGPMTDEQLYKIARSNDENWLISPSGLRSRRAELTPPRGSGIRDSGREIAIESGRGAIVWVLDEGVETPAAGKCGKRDD